MKRVIFAIGLVLTIGLSASADIITQWNFNNITPGNISTATPSAGVGTVSLLGGVTTPNSGSSGAGSTDGSAPNLALQTTTYAAQGAGDRTRGVQFNVSTLGFQDVVVTWDQRHSNSSSRFVQFQYTTDGSSWTDFGGLFEGTTGDTWFNNRTVNLSSVSGVNNNANFGFRIVAAFDPATNQYVASNAPSTNYASTGTWRFDMVTINGISAVPEPTSMALVGCVIAGAAGLRFRRKFSR